MHIITDETYFITTTVTDWIDVFTRPAYKDIVVDSLRYCQRNKGLKVYAWVLMTNHLHIIASATQNCTLADIMRDFKKFTAKRLLTEIANNQQESRSEWMLRRFGFAGANRKEPGSFCLWQQGYHPELLHSRDFYLQKLNYIHNNPVKQAIVAQPEHYLYSSAIDYAGGKGLLDVTIIT